MHILASEDIFSIQNLHSNAILINNSGWSRTEKQVIFLQDLAILKCISRLKVEKCSPTNSHIDFDIFQIEI